MKKIILVVLIAAGMSLSLSAQNNPRPYTPESLLSLSADNNNQRMEAVGPLCNPPYIPIPQFIRIVIDPLLFNLAADMFPYRHHYKPIGPNKLKKNVSAPLPKTKAH